VFPGRNDIFVIGDTAKPGRRRGGTVGTRASRPRRQAGRVRMSLAACSHGSPGSRAATALPLIGTGAISRRSGGKRGRRRRSGSFSDLRPYLRGCCGPPAPHLFSCRLPQPDRRRSETGSGTTSPSSVAHVLITGMTHVCTPRRLTFIRYPDAELGPIEKARQNLPPIQDIFENREVIAKLEIRPRSTYRWIKAAGPPLF